MCHAGGSTKRQLHGGETGAMARTRPVSRSRQWARESENEDCDTEARDRGLRVKTAVGHECPGALRPRLSWWLVGSSPSLPQSQLVLLISLPPKSVLLSCLGPEVRTTSLCTCGQSVRSPQFYLINISTESRVSCPWVSLAWTASTLIGLPTSTAASPVHPSRCSQ